MENYIRVNETTGQQEYVIDFDGVTAQLPILPLPSGVKICFFNLHGNVLLTEKCARLLNDKIGDSEVLIHRRIERFAAHPLRGAQYGHAFLRRSP